MSNERASSSGSSSESGPPEGRDRHAYLEEQVQKQARGEPIDVEWVSAELARIRDEVARRRTRIQRQFLFLALLSAAAMLVLWIRGGGLAQPGGSMFLGLILIGLLAVWALSKRKRQ